MVFQGVDVDDANFMCADIVSSRDLQERLGQFAYRRLQRDYRRLAGATAGRNGGSLLGCDGDAVFCWFPSAAGALHAAHDLQDALASATGALASVALRIGLDSGRGRYRGAGRTGRELVALGARILLSRLLPIQTWSGDRIAQAATVLVPLWSAARLCEAASPGEILVSDAMASALGSRGERFGAAVHGCPPVEPVASSDSPPATRASAGAMRQR